MTLLPRSLAARLLLASIAAAAGVLALQQSLREPVRAASRAAVRPPARPSALASLGFPVMPAAGEVLLCSRIEAVPPDTAPVLRVLADGALAVLRPPALAPGPGAAAARPRATAVVVPPAPYAGWPPPARSALLELLGALLPERPLPVQRVRAVDVALGSDELAALCRWVP